MTHKIISFIKSGIRIVGYILLAKVAIQLQNGYLMASSVILTFSELWGIFEEIGE